MSFLVQIEKIVAGGDGLGRRDGRVVFVPRTAPGERHRVEPLEEKKDYIRARSVGCVEPSSSRRKPPCPYYERCGGCSLMHLSPEAQLQAKKGILVESLARNGVSPDDVTAASAAEVGYRTRLRFHVSSDGGRLSMGFHRQGSHRVEDVEHCLLASERLNATWRLVRAWVQENPARGRALASIELQESTDAAGRIAGRFLVRSSRGIHEFDRDRGNELLARARLEGFVVGDERGGREVRRGRPVVQHRVGRSVFQQSVGSFFQTNRFLLEKLVSAVVPTTPVRRFIDLYCGVGLFTIPLSGMAREIVGVEASAGARRDARANARIAGRDEIRFLLDDASRFAQSFRFFADDYVVLDPPRGGLPRALRESLAASPLRGFCYVSCDPPALGRDAAFFQARGFRVGALRLLDLFPNTHHFETIAHFSRPDP